MIPVKVKLNGCFNELYLKEVNDNEKIELFTMCPGNHPVGY